MNSGVLTVNHAQGLQCNDFDTNMKLTFDKACMLATLETTTDNCTGGRTYFEATTILTKR